MNRGAQISSSYCCLSIDNRQGHKLDHAGRLK